MGGVASAELSNIGIVNFRTETVPSGPTNVTITANNLLINAAIDFPGSIIVAASDPTQVGLKVLKPIRMTGCVTANCGIVAGVDFVCSTPFVLNSTQSCTSTLALNSSLQVPSLVITESGSLQVGAGSQNTFINGTVYNFGFVDVRPGYNFSILGDYYQGVNGTCGVGGLVSGESSGPISVNGSVFLNGTLLYQLAQNQSKSNSNQFGVMTVTGTIYGKLRGVPVNGSDLNATSVSASRLTVSYGEHVVYLVLTPPYSPSLLWLLVPVGAGIFVVVILSIVMVIRNRRRSNYIPINSPADAPVEAPVESPP